MQAPDGPICCRTKMLDKQLSSQRCDRYCQAFCRSHGPTCFLAHCLDILADLSIKPAAMTASDEQTPWRSVWQTVQGQWLSSLFATVQ